MNENTLNLVSAIINKDATEIESFFNAAMAEKISTRLDDMHAVIAQSMFAETEEITEEDKKPSLGALAATHWHHHTWAAHGQELNDMSSSAASKHRKKAKEIHAKIEQHHGKEVADAVAKHSEHASDHDADTYNEQPKGFHKDFVAKHLGGHGSVEHKAYQTQHKKHDKEEWSTHQTDEHPN